MTDPEDQPTPGGSHEPGRGPDEPDRHDPLTVEDILAAAGAPEALAVLEAQAERADPEPVALRVARAGEQSVVVDLGSAEGHAVLVGPGGRRLVERSPVLYRRSRLTAPIAGSPGSAGASRSYSCVDHLADDVRQ